MTTYFKTNFKKILISIYVLIVLGFAASAKADFKPLITPSTYKGEVAQTVDGKFYLILDNKRYFELKSNVDLSPFNGWAVAATGYETIRYKVGPALLDPNYEAVDKTTAAPVLYVISINGISQQE